MKDRWLRFKEGFVSVWRLLYRTEADGTTDWYAQIGGILGTIALVGMWWVVGKVIVGLFKWVVT
jgi:hypothetical protein